MSGAPRWGNTFLPKVGWRATLAGDAVGTFTVNGASDLDSGWRKDLFKGSQDYHQSVDDDMERPVHGGAYGYLKWKMGWKFWAAEPLLDTWDL